MNESIIRRFAKYHERHYAITHPGISTDEAIADLAEHLRTTERNVIQTLTRIEDAEAAMDLAKAWAAGDPQSNALYIHADKMFARAGINMWKWLDVKV